MSHIYAFFPSKYNKAEEHTRADLQQGPPIHAPDV